jgi:Tol biopolymer transport system component
LAGDTTNDRHVFVMAVDGSRETAAIEHPSQNKVMGWSPDGTALLFASDRSGSIGLWTVRVSDGTPQGAATLADIGTSWSNGVTASGTMYVWKSASPTYIQVAPIDVTAGKLVPTPSPIFQRFIASRGRPAWSADGKFLAYSSCGGLGGDGCTLFIRSMETGQVRELRSPLAYFQFPRWSPTGRALMAPGTDLKGRQALFSIDAQTGDVSVLLTRDEVDKDIAMAQWGPDGKSVYYRTRDQRLISRDLASGKETEIGRASNDWRAFAVSPDGRSVAAITTDAPGNTTVVVGPLQGERRTVLRLTSPASIVLPQDFAWTLDERAVIAVKQPTQDRDHNELWLVPVDGAPPRRLDINTDSWQLDNGFRLSPDGRQIAFVASAGKRGEEIWALENFLPAQAAAKPGAKK